MVTRVMERFQFCFLWISGHCGVFIRSKPNYRINFDPSSVPVGLLASALLVVNNFRDIETDAETGKQTFAVRLGKAKTKMFFALLLMASLGMYVLIAVVYTYLVLITLVVIPLILK